MFPSRPAHNRNLQSSHSRHEQESSQHMAAVASYLASLSPSPSPLVTSIHMCSPSFRSLSLSPPFRPLRSPALSISYPSLPAVFRYLPPLPFSLSNTQNLSVFPALCHQKKKHTQFARAAAFMRAGECKRDGGGGGYIA